MKVFFAGTSDTKICGVNLNCSREALRTMLSRESNMAANDRCNCMQLCTNIEYDFQIKVNPLPHNFSKVLMKNFFHLKRSKLHYSFQTIFKLVRAEFYFSGFSVIGSTRSALISFTGEWWKLTFVHYNYFLTLLQIFWPLVEVFWDFILDSRFYHLSSWCTIFQSDFSAM